MRGQESSGAAHSGLHLIQHEQRSVAAAQRLRCLKILRRGHPDSAFRLDRLHDEGRELLGGELFLEGVDVEERDGFRAREQGAEAFPPELIAHQRKRPAGEPVKRAFGIQQAGAPGGGARELDDGFDALAARTGEKHALQTAAGARRQALRQFRRQPGHVALQHGRPLAIQFFLERGNNGRMVVPDVMHAIAGEEIENAPSVRGEEFAARTALVGHIHLQQVEQANPLRIHMFSVQRVDRRDG